VEDLDFVKSIIAAGIAEEEMTGCPTEGTGLDELLLQTLFDENDVSVEERQRLRDQARTDILKDLRNPTFRKALWSRARFFQRILERDLWMAPLAQAVAA
jgi:hypothetical protein